MTIASYYSYGDKAANDPTARKSFDYVVIGSGSAGSTVAARLAEDKGLTVALLEAGPSDQHIHIRMPAALGFPLMNDRFNWYYTSEPDPNINNRTILEARGRVLGGSSSINGMNWVRGNPWDYDNWGTKGLDSWSYAQCLPYFKRAETFDKGPNAYRGGSGPMKIETSGAKGPLYEAFLQSGVEMGLQHVEDHNGFQQEGVHVTQRNIHNGIRCSSFEGYIRSQPMKTNLTVFTGARVTSIETSNRRAVRVHMLHNGQKTALEIDREVILCGGAINSPQLLQLSGIGNGDDLKAAGIRIGLSTHDAAERAIALKAEPDYIALGPINPTTTKSTGRSAQGIAGISAWRATIGAACPLIAIGGITLEQAPDIVAAGADSCSVVSDVLSAADPEARARQWLAWADTVRVAT